MYKKPNKIISFSLWGANPKYTVGAVKNAALAKEIYPGWTCRFYVSKDVPEDIIAQLKSYDNTEVFVMNEPADHTAMFWRFYPMCDGLVDVMISRDTDSRLSAREKAAVDEWLASGLPLHIMRDHSWHVSLMMGGMWGCLPRYFSQAAESLASFQRQNAYDTDQRWLREKLFPAASSSAMIHDEIHSGRKFPTPRAGGEYVGAPFNENDELEIQFK